LKKKTHSCADSVANYIFSIAWNELPKMCERLFVTTRLLSRGILINQIPAQIGNGARDPVFNQFFGSEVATKKTLDSIALLVPRTSLPHSFLCSRSRK
jgi:hypothetical protein